MPPASPTVSPEKTAAKKAAAKRASKKAPAAETPAETASNAVDEQLARYRSMRDFHTTAEPSGTTKSTNTTPAGHLPFCIQKHAASHLHYDFRLGWNGVLKSWAVAKGPSYVTADKRLAVEVEDHPIEYGGFEGIIPKGQYGGGTVMLWDQGTWEPQPIMPDVNAGLRNGSLKFVLRGQKLQGKWALIRMGASRSSGSMQRPGQRFSGSTKPQWLLIKEHDEFERKSTDPAITEEADRSVITNRTMDEIAASEDHVWNSKETAAASPDAPAWRRQEPKAVTETRVPPPSKAPSMNGIAKLPKESQPDFLSPQLAQQAENPPSSEGWVHELKLDGYRIQARKSGSTVALLTRKGLDWTHRMPDLAREIARIPAESATLDGEVVVLAADGNTSFADLQAAFQNDARHHLTFFAFDLLHLNGHNPRNLPLIQRKALLAPLLVNADADTLRLSEHLEGDGVPIFHNACKLHAEGIISKLANSPYRPGRASAWLKSKCLFEQELVIAGYTLPGAGHTGMYGIGSLVLGYYEASAAANGKQPRLIYAGRTGTGFNAKTHKLLRDRLDPLKQPSTALDRPPAEARKDAIWVRPELVAQVRFATWTADNLVRQAAFLGLREDKPAREVTRETSAPTPKRSRAEAREDAEEPEAEATKNAVPSRPKRSEVEKPVSAPATSARVPHSSTAPSSLGGAAPTQTAVGTSAKGATHTSLSRRPRSAPDNATRGLNARHKSATEPGVPPHPLPPLEHPPIRLTHPQKVLDPETNLTKQQLADYYWAVAPLMLPHVADRPVSLVRCPEGASNPCFYQKHVNHMLPKGIGGVPVADKDGKVEPYITLNDPSHNREALAGLAQMGVLEVHPWGSTNADIEHPNRLVIDLDPDEDLPWSTVAEAAQEVRARLKKLGLTSFLKTTGGKGLHVVIPIQPTLPWPEAKEWAHRFVLSLEKANTRLYLTKMTKAARKNRIYLDYLRNERGATAVAPYSPRARSGAAVSMPLAWAEISKGPYASERPVFEVASFPAWRDRLRKDPWKDIANTNQPVPAEP